MEGRLFSTWWLSYATGRLACREAELIQIAWIRNRADARVVGRNSRVVLLGAGLIFNIDGLVAAGALSLISALLGLVFGLMRRR